MSRGWIYFLLLVTIAVAYTTYYIRISTVTPATLTVTPHPQPKPVTPPVIEKAKKPAKSLSTIPFYSQAPGGVWDPLHEDACEEAAVLIVKYWAEDVRPSLAAHDQNLKDFIGWQTTHGYGKSLSIPELYQAVKDFYNFEFEVVEVKTAAGLKSLIDAGRPVIWPADGKKLNNPHFQNGGPLYHMLVVSGYEGDTFITQDPGTRHGQNYRYSAATLMAAQADWDGTHPVSTDHRVLTIQQ